MTIILVVNKTLPRGANSYLDSAYYNFYIPLLELGHKVFLYDTIKGNEKPFENLVKEINPDLIISILTGNRNVTPYEPIDQIESITKQNKIKTFNWFCDDTWRFDSFNKDICKKFTACSTPEANYINKYKQEGYNNILLGIWHCNQDLKIDSDKVLNVTFCGGLTSSRAQNFNYLGQNNIDLKYFHGLSYEDLFKAYSISKIGLNLTVNDNDIDKKPQMKLRIFEIPASKTFLLTEYIDDLENYFEIGKEIETFKTIEEAKDKIDFYLKNDSARENIANAGYQRFLRDHTSRIRLNNIINQIEAL